ncbi:MAG: 50S ribosomal protein L31 [Parcubacteria group bacterium]|nr:50S ribosomal protein L31 [Parcubacteria group bacterium]
MKKDAHPTYYSDAKVTCACGNSFSVGSTQKEIHTEICSNCHPFYTGKQNLIDTAGRVERFQAMVKKTEGIKTRGRKKKADEKVAAAPLDNRKKLEQIKANLDAK